MMNRRKLLGSVCIVLVMTMLHIVLVAYKFKSNWMKKYSKGANQ